MTNACLNCGRKFSLWEQIKFDDVPKYIDKRIFQCFECRFYTEVFIKTVKDLMELIPRPSPKRLITGVTE